MTLPIIIVTAVIFIICFGNRALFDRLSMRPYRVTHDREWYRVLTHMFLHGDYMHLIINMIVLLSFGRFIEQAFAAYHDQGLVGNPAAAYLVLYFGGGIAATVHDLVKRRNDPGYTSVGASGGVAAVIFASIFLDPWNKIYFFGVIPIPGIIFGALYIIYSRHMGRRNADHINHYAHLYGALFGFIFPALLNSSFVNVFISNISNIDIW